MLVLVDVDQFVTVTHLSEHFTVFYRSNSLNLAKKCAPLSLHQLPKEFFNTVQIKYISAGQLTDNGSRISPFNQYDVINGMCSRGKNLTNLAIIRYKMV